MMFSVTARKSVPATKAEDPGQCSNSGPSKFLCGSNSTPGKPPNPIGLLK